MHTPDYLDLLIVEVAKAADLCFKPWVFSVLKEPDGINPKLNEEPLNELLLRLECRTSDGERVPPNDLEVEIYRSGGEMNITIAWLQYPERPMLWQGKYSLWMDGSSGRKCVMPTNGESIEAFARKLRSIFTSLISP